VRLEEPARLPSEVVRALYVSAAVLVAIGALGIAWAVPQLADGAGELPRHWWSSVPVGLVVLGGALAAIAWLLPRRARRGSKPV
jgi:hypothetical protein